MQVKTRDCPYCETEVILSDFRCSKCGKLMKPMLKNASSAVHKGGSSQSKQNTDLPESSFEQLRYLFKDAWHFNGRMGRLEMMTSSFVLWIVAGLSLAIAIGVALLGMIILPTALVMGLFSIALIGVSIAATYAGVAITARRLHDLGYSGWLMLISLIPLVNFLLSLALIFMKGKPSSNSYGQNPLTNQTVKPVSLGLAIGLYFFTGLLIMGLIMGSGFGASMLFDPALLNR